MNEVIASGADEVLMHLRQHRPGALGQSLRYPDAGTEAAIALTVWRRKWDHENVERAVVPGRDFVRPPTADRQVIELAGVDHFAVERGGVIIADGESVLVAGS